MARTQRSPNSAGPDNPPDLEADSPALRALNRAGAAASIALRGVRLTSRLSGMCQRTTIEQTFVNAEREAIEAVYIFPLPEAAAVCGFEVVTGDRVLTGQVEESEKAIDQYEQAIGEGHGAFVTEQERPDVCTVRAGNLKPKQAATIRLTYVCPLEKVDNQIRVAFPTTIAPRFISDAGTDPLQAMIDGDALNPPHVLRVPYGLSIDVTIDLGRELKGVSSPSHAIRVEPDELGAVRVTFAGGPAEMNRAVVLSIELSREHRPGVQVERGENGGSYLAVTFVPEFEVDELANPAPAETVFVLDCSGSMQGQSIDQATAALGLCLRAMRDGDTFNICRFGSDFELMSSEPLLYSQQTLEQALAFVYRGANLGGTELYAPLEAILRSKPVAGNVRNVVLLTDGQVSNEPACIDLARRNRLRNRIFSFGIGPACSEHLVRGLARATGGMAEFISQGERIEEKVLRTFSRLASPMVSDVSIDWGGAEVQTLAELPPVFDGDVLAVFGRAVGRLPENVTLSCTTEAGPRSWTVSVPPPADHGGVIRLMWARRTIRSIEEVNGLTGSRARPAVRGRERETLVSLSREYGLLCSLTTFIAIEHRTPEERNEGRPALRRVPVQLANGWGGVAASPALSRSLDLSVDRSIDKSIDRSIDRCGDTSDTILHESVDGLTNLERLGWEPSEWADQGPLLKLLMGLISEAFRFSASEIHVEPMRDRVRVRVRAAAGLVEWDKIKPSLRKPLLSRIKRAAGLDVNQSALPQDGTMRLAIDGKVVDLHVSTVPTFFGESAVLRFAPGTNVPPNVTDLQRLLAAQQADGRFAFPGHADADPELVELIARAGHDAEAWRAEVRAVIAPVLLPPARDPQPDWAATAIALLTLSVCFPDRKDVWQRAYSKGIRFLSGATGSGAAEVQKWLTDLEAKFAVR